MQKYFLLILWRVLVGLGNIKNHDKGIMPALMRAWAWDVACLYHQQIGRFPYDDWRRATNG